MKIFKHFKKLWCFILCLIGPTPAFATSPYYQWVEYGPNDQWIVRSIVSPSSDCPSIITNEAKPLPMVAKSALDENYPIKVCQAVLPHTVTKASINDVSLPLPVATPTTIVVMGDTGCYLNNCQNSRRWPFPVIANQAASFKPDLVIHVGDYVYSQSKDSPKYTWHEWQADFFKPAKPLLKAAPWIFARGNHESCDEAGIGWDYLLDPFSFKHCFNRSPLYSVNIANTKIFVMDSSSSNNKFAPLNEVSWFSQYFFQIAQSKTKNNWIVTHQPIWFIHKNDSLNTSWQKHMLNTLQKAWTKIQPQNVNLILAGHIHRFEVLNFRKSRPPQVIVGTSGASLDKTLKETDLQGMISSGMPIDNGLSLNQFGFLVLKKQKNVGNIWTAQFYNPQGNILADCLFDQEKFSCE